MAFDYPKAGRGAPPEVRDAIARFHRLSNEEKAELPLLWALLGPDASTRDYKMAKRDAGYVHHPVGSERCANCKFAYFSLYEKVHVCSQVAGEIRLNGWCRLWEG